MGTTYKGIYIPSVGETGWGTLVNNNWTLLADHRVTAQSLFLPAAVGSFEVVPTQDEQPVGGGSPSSIYGFQMPDGATSYAVWTFGLPKDAAFNASGSFLIRPFWGPSASVAGASAVRWTVDVKLLSGLAGPQAYNTTGPSVVWTGSSVTGRTANAAFQEPGQAITTNVLPGNWYRVNLGRFGADAADTVTATVELLGLQIDYTAI